MDPAPKKPQLYLPKRPPNNGKKNDSTKEGPGHFGEEATATLGSFGTGQPATFPNLNARSNDSYGVADTQALQEALMRLHQQQGQEGASAGRDFPPDIQVVRGEDQGLATGMFCPLCLGDLFQFVVSERRGFVMCPSRQVANPSPMCIISGLNFDMELSI